MLHFENFELFLFLFAGIPFLLEFVIWLFAKKESSIVALPLVSVVLLLCGIIAANVGLPFPNLISIGNTSGATAAGVVGGVALSGTGIAVSIWNFLWLLPDAFQSIKELIDSFKK